jgi:ubiquinone/menaquinone biosynthesis C-methylase UbiE
MGFYHDRVLPLLIDLSMRQRRLADYRHHVVPAARGRVLEVGIGSGLNLPLYGADVSQVIGLDPSSKLLTMTSKKVGSARIAVDLVEGSAEAVPLDDRSVDTVVTTWTMCSIPDIERALREMHRVLRPDGRLLFVEHGLAPQPGIRWWQDRLTPLWKRIGGGCHLNRPIATLIEHAGFKFERLATGYMRGPKPMAFMYEGSARPQ